MTEPAPAPAPDDVEKFIGRLVHLRRKGAGPVARLRRGAGGHLGERADAMTEFFALHPPRRLEGPCYLAATCWALGELHSPRLASFGSSLRLLDARGQQGAAQRYLRLLLESDRADLTTPVTSACRILAAHKVPVNFHRLVWDVASWDNPNRHARQRVARDFHNVPDFASPQAEDA